MNRHTLSIAAFLTCTPIMGAFAQANSNTTATGDADPSAQTSGTTSAVPGNSVTQLNTITVTGRKFLDEDTSGITNLPLPIEKVPQSISLVNNDFIKAADLKNMGEIAQYTNGALWASYSPSYGNQVWLRGFSAGYAIDGLTVGDQITEPDPATLERYEVVKGPASVVYGAQSPGGIINLVSKSASPDTPNYVQVLGGSWGRWRLEGQVAGSLNESGSVRGIAVAAQEDGGSFVHHVGLEKSVLYGGLDIDFDEHVKGYVRASYQRTEDTPYNGIPTYPDGSLVPVSRSFFLGGSDLSAVAHASRIDSGVTWTPSDLWSFDLKGIYQYTTHGGSNAYPYDFIAYDGTFPIGGEQFNNWHVNDFTVAASAMRKLDDLGLSDSSVSANVRYQQYRYYIDESFLTGGPADISQGEAAVNDVFNNMIVGSGSYQQDQKMDYLTVSSQAVIKVAAPLTLVGGVAFSKPSIDLQVDHGAWKNLDPGSQVNYRGAAIFQASDNLNLYASYSESYQPNLRLDVQYDVLPPVSGKQYEVGAKYLSSERLLLTAALFEIRENNVAIYDSMVNGEALYRASDVRHRGAELEATGRLADHWQVKGGVAVLDSVVTKDPENPANNGERQPWLPRTTANLFTSYDFASGVSVSGGMRYVGSVKTYDSSSATPTPSLRSYLVADAGVSYAIDKWLLQLNLKNLFDKHYVVSTPIFQSLSAGLYPGEPRSVSVSVRRDF
ncbi:MAG TPA: TonB-dependent siderophore receptor [Dyella sp.]|uniref:TonB-dependent siderophore receptor n=1 Tax=Dyella sp. TaxID=1869338 RepID=UPI002D7854FB|nr:TonB-dependent siderophore receptor [Dyella sp.]HET6553073.1 TonB-dependent siderophore receptor [Dyella sp.]